MQNRDVISTLQGRKDELEKLGIIHLRLFGSHARGDAGASSDIDLAATLDPKARIGLRFVSIAEYLEQLLGAPVDLISYPPANMNIKSAIDREGRDVF